MLLLSVNTDFHEYVRLFMDWNRQSPTKRDSPSFTLGLLIVLYGEVTKLSNDLFNDALRPFYLRLYGRREENVLFNDALSTRLYGVRRNYGKGPFG